MGTALHRQHHRRPGGAGWSAVVLEYRNAPAKSFPGEPPDNIARDGWAHHETDTQQLDPEKLIANPGIRSESRSWYQRNVGLRPREYRASHKIRGTALDQTGDHEATELE